jgi:hypothetical protein
MRKG